MLCGLTILVTWLKYLLISIMVLWFQVYWGRRMEHPIHVAEWSQIREQDRVPIGSDEGLPADACVSVTTQGQRLCQNY